MNIQRKSYTETNKIYFFTATIHKWFPLLIETKNKELVINYLKHLSDKGFLKIFAFVIMSNPAYQQAGIFILFGNNFIKMEMKRHKEVF